MSHDIIEKYLRDVLRPQLDVFDASLKFVKTVTNTIRNQIHSCIYYWNDEMFRKGLLAIGAEEGLFYYWILYYAYLSPSKLKSADEIVERVQMHLPHITRDTYYRHRKRAVKTFSSVLWGFTAKREIGALDSFV